MNLDGMSKRIDALRIGIERRQDEQAVLYAGAKSVLLARLARYDEDEQAVLIARISARLQEARQ